MCCLKPHQYYRFKALCVPIFEPSYRYMGGAPKPRRRMTPADCADRINELNIEEQKMMLAMLLKRQKKNKKIYKDFGAFNVNETETVTSSTEEESLSNNGTIDRPTSAQLRQLAIFQAMPFIGFGFLDNFIMIVAGEYIDIHIGATLSISTMAAAALGNTVSDVFGIGSAWYVEHWSAKLGIHAPPLTLEQMQLTSCRITANAGRALGVMFGCIIGMIPLLFIENNKDEEEENIAEENTTNMVAKS